MVSTADPPHQLQLVIDFVNTLDIEDGEDSLATPELLAAWLHDRDLLAGGPGRPAARPEVSDLARAVQLREALRGALLAHTHGEPEDAAELERAARRGGLSVSFSGGAATISARSQGIDGALARVLVPAAYAALDGSWLRVKACDADDCLEAFYDHSRNRAGRWCDMAVCGNRTKVRHYRARRDR